MKISEKRIVEIIAEEKQRLLNEKKVAGAQYALKEIAMQSAILHDSSLDNICEKDLLKIKELVRFTIQQLRRHSMLGAK